uniref:mitotic apparatus protein p62-like isoform X1 n=2 Tax=Osmia lignaria TaxID=473952 RepID=UPI001478EBE5|nr:mitotic apparatus protein p62-like isoform X1 [Osmia lignaria]
MQFSSRTNRRMRLSTVVELLLILLLVAFAAYGRVIERDEHVKGRAIKEVNGSKQSHLGISTLSLKQATDDVNRYCTCNENICNCCRDFHIPLVQLQGPGCASLQYLQEDNLAVQLSFGDNILTSTIVNGKNPKPVCVPLPGGFTKFCGRIYSIKRDVDNHFKACLGLELQSATELEASLRVSCFRFGPDGLKLRPAEPLPVVEAEVPEEEDDDDFFGLGSDDDDDEEDNEGISPLANSVPNSSPEEEEDEEEDEDILGFGALLDIITGEDESTTKKPKVTTAPPLLQFTIPLLTKPTTAPFIESYDASTEESNETGVSNSEEQNEYNQELSAEEGSGEEDYESASVDTTGSDEIVTESSNKIASYAKPDKLPTKKFTAPAANKKKPTVTSSSINAIQSGTNEKKKPLKKKPVKGDDDDDDDDILGDDLDDDDDEEEELLDDDDEDEKYSEEDDDEKVEETEHESNEDEDEKTEVEELDDDDDEEDAVISALVYDEKEDGKKKGKVKKHTQSSETEDDDLDYEMGLSGLLARSRHSKSSRQSKVMRL